MGEVYRGHDTDLKRDVAIKVLSDPVARDAERLARFQREARVLASLNHPNIATIHGLQRIDGTTALVMEFVDGGTLADRIARGPIPVDEALVIARQIAEALEAAHEHGVIHRDLKPANIKVRDDGTVKVLDYGLAKAMTGDAPGADLSQLPTITQDGTRDGTVLGTPAYMSPEQARGKPVDKRADIWAFGCVLYEMLTGRRAFRADDAAGTLTSLIRDAPDWTALPPETPVSVRRLLERCLRKDPRERLPHVGVARMELVDARTADDLSMRVPDGQSADTGSVASTRRGLRQWVFVAMIAVLLVALAVIAVKTVVGRPVSQRPQPLRVTISPPASYHMFTESPSLAIAPDARTVAFVASRDGARQLFLRRLDEFEPRAVRGSDGASSPFFSPDGQRVAFFAAGKLLSVAVAPGSIPATICDARDGALAPGEWAADGTILFTPLFTEGLSRVTASGGTPTRVTVVDRSRSERTHRWPQVLPGGRLLYTVYFLDSDRSEVRVFADGSSRTVVDRGAAGRYVDGHLLWLVAGSLFAAPFDLNTLSLAGEPTLVLDDVLTSGENSEALHFSAAAGQSLLYVPRLSTGALKRALVQVDRKAQARTLLTTDRPVRGPRFSSDGKRLLFHAGRDVWMYEIATEVWTRLTFDGTNLWPIWTPDGTRMLFQSFRTGRAQIFSQPVRAGADAELVLSTELSHWPASLTPDGEVLVFNEDHPISSGDIWTLRLNGKHQPMPFIRTPPTTWAGGLRSDGKWLVYVSLENGRWDVFVTAFPSGEGKWQISNDGGTEPIWSPDGRELFYRADDRMMVVSIETTPEFSYGNPRTLFEGRYLHCCAGLPEYAVAPDGKTLLMLAGGAEQAAEEIRFVQGWFTR
jgi:serine/threonine protein kinase/Tol biopolymer transport system component